MQCSFLGNYVGLPGMGGSYAGRWTWYWSMSRNDYCPSSTASSEQGGVPQVASLCVTIEWGPVTSSTRPWSLSKNSTRSLAKDPHTDPHLFLLVTRAA